MRRITLGLIFCVCGIAPALTQQAVKVPIIGWLTPATTESYQQPGAGNPGPQLLRDSLAKHGLIDGKTIRLDMRLAEGRLDRLPGLAEALVREGATVILAYGEPAARAAQVATKTIPTRARRVGPDVMRR